MFLLVPLGAPKQHLNDPDNDPEPSVFPASITIQGQD